MLFMELWWKRIGGLTSPVWLRLWVARELGRVNRLVHNSHLYLLGVPMAGFSIFALKLVMKSAPGMDDLLGFLYESAEEALVIE